MPAAPRTALYLRVSTAEQKPDLQYDGLRSYAARAGLEITGSISMSPSPAAGRVGRNSPR